MNRADENSGYLYLVATPIGNLDDMTPRAVSVLTLVDLVAAEDTRRTLKLLNHLDLKKKLVSYHEHNRRDQEAYLLDRLREGQHIALVTDAGTPCISDPGNDLVNRCIEEQIAVVPVPGACAAITALSASGLSPGRFVFEGFLPAKGRERKDRVSQITVESRNMVCYEAPHRLRKTLSDFAAAGLDLRLLSVGRELTKRHETIWRTTVGEAADYYTDHDPRGEFVLVLEGVDEFARRRPDLAGTPDDTFDEQRLKTLLEQLRDQDMSLKDAVRECMSVSGKKRNDIYPLALSVWQEK